jgi:hypothetical protein
MAAEVIAIEVKQYVGPEGLRTLVPRVIGQTAAAETRKGSRETRQWDETSFLEELKAKRGPAEAGVAGELIQWARSELPRFTWGTGSVIGSFIPVLDHAGRDYFPLALWTNGRAEIQFKPMSRRPPFDEVRLRREFLRRLNEIAGLSIPEAAVTRVPSIRLALFAASPEALDSFKGSARLVLRDGASRPGGSPGSLAARCARSATQAGRGVSSSRLPPPTRTSARASLLLPGLGQRVGGRAERATVPALKGGSHVVCSAAAGRRRSTPLAATRPGFYARRPLHNKGQRYAAEPPSVDEIVAVTRRAGHTRHGHRQRADRCAVACWRRIQEALSLTER